MLLSRDNFKKRNFSEWKDMISTLFPNTIPDKFEWTKSEDIIEVLDLLAKSCSNHMFLPTGGGLDLLGSNASLEKECIKLITGNSGAFAIVKPKKLIFHSLGDDNSWDYFRLETNSLNPSGVYDNVNQKEELVYLSDGTYLDRSNWDKGFYEDRFGNYKEFQSEDTILIRYTSPGAFLLVAKASVYNSISGTYDGRHNKRTDDEFFNYMKRSKDKFDSKK